MLKIYLAGPDVFEKDAIKQGARLKKLCEKYGFIGLFPLDNEISDAGTPLETATLIREANLKLIKDADIILANLSPFRGLEPDSGTIYEIGYATALNKQILAYTQDLRPMIERIQEAQHLPASQTLCKEGKIIEDFGLPQNLMLLNMSLFKSVEEALQSLASKSV